MDDAPLNPETLRASYGEARELSIKKERRTLDAHCRRFIALSPFLVLATSGEGGRVDASPRGDAPGFVAVIDDRTLLLPDRPGNNRIDSLRNVLDNPQMGLIFLVPGINETLRINGKASITFDEALLAPLAANGKKPRSGLLVAVEEVFFHCGKAMIRSDLWNPEKRAPRGAFPSLGQVLADQIGGMDPVKTEESVQEGYRTRLY
jgi:PPOX class probable FMN-dependent enzyme